MICDSSSQPVHLVLLYNFSKDFWVKKWRRDQFSAKFISYMNYSLNYIDIFNIDEVFMLDISYVLFQYKYQITQQSPKVEQFGVLAS